MKLKKFFKKLDKYYSRGIKTDTDNIVLNVKFYLQNNTFSYEVFFFENPKINNFTDRSKVIFESEVFYDVLFDKKVRKEIIEEIESIG